MFGRRLLVRPKRCRGAARETKATNGIMKQEQMVRGMKTRSELLSCAGCKIDKGYRCVTDLNSVRVQSTLADPLAVLNDKIIMDVVGCKNATRMSSRDVLTT